MESCCVQYIGLRGGQFESRPGGGRDSAADYNLSNRLPEPSPAMTDISAVC